MKYQSAAAFRQALDAQLKARARERGVDVNRLRTRLAFERFLARLFATGDERWVLKGGTPSSCASASGHAPRETWT